MATETQDKSEPERLIDVAEVAARCGVRSARTIRRWYGAYGKKPLVPKFPAPVTIGGVQRWRESDLNQFFKDPS